jgi:hypothetical protein
MALNLHLSNTRTTLKRVYLITDDILGSVSATQSRIQELITETGWPSEELYLEIREEEAVEGAAAAAAAAETTHKVIKISRDRLVNHDQFESLPSTPHWRTAKEAVLLREYLKGVTGTLAAIP